MAKALASHSLGGSVKITRDSFTYNLNRLINRSRDSRGKFGLINIYVIDLLVK